MTENEFLKGFEIHLRDQKFRLTKTLVIERLRGRRCPFTGICLITDCKAYRSCMKRCKGYRCNSYVGTEEAVYYYNYKTKKLANKMIKITNKVFKGTKNDKAN